MKYLNLSEYPKLKVILKGEKFGRDNDKSFTADSNCLLWYREWDKKLSSPDDSGWFLYGEIYGYVNTDRKSSYLYPKYKTKFENYLIKYDNLIYKVTKEGFRDVIGYKLELI